MRTDNGEFLYYDHIFGFIPADQRNKGKSKYFVAYAFDHPFSKDLRRTIRQAFEPDLIPYFADDELEPRHILIKIARRIYTTRFGLYDLSNISPSVYIELGIAFGVNKPILPIVRLDSIKNIPEWFGNIEKLEYLDFGDLFKKLRNSRIPTLMKNERGKILQTMCNFCQKVCTGRDQNGKSRYYLVLDATIDVDFDKDFRKAVHEGLSSTELEMKTLKINFSESWELCQLAREINDAEFTIIRIDEDTAPVVFFWIWSKYRIP